jgi:hypothetical protein
MGAVQCMINIANTPILFLVVQQTLPSGCKIQLAYAQFPDSDGI